MTGANKSQPVTRLRCGGCGLAYSPAALTREMALTAGAPCRRCGGKLQASQEEPELVGRRPIRAVRSPVIGSERLPYG
jgi:hypothetical protein